MTEQLLKQLNKDGRLHVVPARVKNKYIIRFTVTSIDTTEEDIKRDWNIIQEIAGKILDKIELEALKLEEIRKFQSSLILSNVPQTPKLVNASFLAFLQEIDMTYEIVKELTNRDYSNSHLPLTPRRKPKLNNNPYQKGISFDQLPLTNMLKECNGKILIVPNIKIKEDDLINSGEKNNNSLGKKINSKGPSKQSSLDSKIEHIFEEVEEADSQINCDQNSLSFN